MNPRCQLLAPFWRQIASAAATVFWPDGTPLIPPTIELYRCWYFELRETATWALAATELSDRLDVAETHANPFGRVEVAAFILWWF